MATSGGEKAMSGCGSCLTSSPSSSPSDSDACGFDLEKISGHQVFDVQVGDGLLVRVKAVKVLSPLEGFAVEADLTGHKLWLGAEILGHYMVQEFAFREHHQKVLELGCGTGLAGLAVAMKFPHLKVSLSDMEPSVLELAGENIPLNGLDLSRVDTVQLEWEVASHDDACALSFDVIIASDVCYAQEVLPALFATAGRLLTKKSGNCFVICNCQNRLFCEQSKANDLMKTTASQFGFDPEKVVTVDVDQFLGRVGAMDLKKVMHDQDQDMSLLCFYI